MMKVTIQRNNVQWFDYHNNRHRRYGPALQSVNGEYIWCLNGHAHREDGPAVAWSNGAKEWWLNGKFIKS